MDFHQLDKEIVGEAWTSPAVMDHLSYLCDGCNGRFAGTEDERRAGDYLLDRMHAYGLQNTHAELFEMRGWERGTASFWVQDHEREVEIPCIALPGSPGCDLQAELIDVGQGRPEDYQVLGTSAAGKIVLTAADGPARAEKYMHAVEAGVGAFIFTSGQVGNLPPTGSIGKDLPAIGVSFEQAARLKRLLAPGSRQARLSLTCQVRQVTARNIVGEIPGTDPSQGWILACGHYDGHDIAQGAADNAAGVVTLVEAARMLSPLRQHLQAGIRFVCFSGEELGLFGSYAYARDHAAEIDTIRAVVNVDVIGLAMPLVLLPQGSPELAAYLRSLPLNELDLNLRDGPGTFIMNSDHIAFSMAGIQAVWALTSHPATGGGWGHTSADTLDKLDHRIMRQSSAAVTRLLLRMAGDAPNLPPGRRDPEAVKQAALDAGFEKMMRFQGRWPY